MCQQELMCDLLMQGNTTDPAVWITTTVIASRSMPRLAPYGNVGGVNAEASSVLPDESNRRFRVVNRIPHCLVFGEPVVRPLAVVVIQWPK